MIEAKLLNRNAIGIDINHQALNRSKKNLTFKFQSKSKIFLRHGDATNLSFIQDNKIDFICTHPPYANIIKYSHNIENDISLLNLNDFLTALNSVALESYRVLKKNKFCAVMIGDIRKNGNVIPLGFKTLNIFMNSGFSLKEIIIKEQHHCRGSKKWELLNKNFLMLAHEYIFVFYK